MTPRERAGRVLLVEDSEGGAHLMRIAFAERLPDAELVIVETGEQALEALLEEGAVMPDFVLLDLNLPGLAGHEILAAVRVSDEDRVRRLPVVVLSHSEAEADVLRSYDLGANSHIAKPHSLDRLFEVVEALGRYWLEIVTLPSS
jgi:chemotaxis family two-component system response regulator Rcp1